MPSRKSASGSSAIRPASLAGTGERLQAEAARDNSRRRRISAARTKLADMVGLSDDRDVPEAGGSSRYDSPEQFTDNHREPVPSRPLSPHALVSHAHLLPHPHHLLAPEVDLEELAAHHRVAL